MTWIIIGLISFTIQMYILKHTWVDSDEGLEKFRWEQAQKLNIYLWVVLLMFLLCIIPILNICKEIAVAALYIAVNCLRITDYSVTVNERCKRHII